MQSVLVVSRASKIAKGLFGAPQPTKVALKKASKKTQHKIVISIQRKTVNDKNCSRTANPAPAGLSCEDDRNRLKFQWSKTGLSNWNSEAFLSANKADADLGHRSLDISQDSNESNANYEEVWEAFVQWSATKTKSESLGVLQVMQIEKFPLEVLIKTVFPDTRIDYVTKYVCGKWMREGKDIAEHLSSEIILHILRMDDTAGRQSLFESCNIGLHMQRYLDAHFYEVINSVTFSELEESEILDFASGHSLQISVDKQLQILLLWKNKNTNSEKAWSQWMSFDWVDEFLLSTEVIYDYFRICSVNIANDFTMRLNRELQRRKATRHQRRNIDIVHDDRSAKDLLSLETGPLSFEEISFCSVSFASSLPLESLDRDSDFRNEITSDYFSGSTFGFSS